MHGGLCSSCIVLQLCMQGCILLLGAYNYCTCMEYRIRIVLESPLVMLLAL